MRRVAIMLAMLGALGCQDEAAPAKAEPGATEPPKGERKRAEVKIPKVSDIAPSTGGKKSWELKIDGKADLSGPSVMMTKPSKVATYGLIGGEAMTNVHVEDGKTDAYMFQVIFAKTGEMCIYRADNKHQSKGLNVTLAGDRYQVDGEISCGPAKNAAAPKTVHKVSGYFEKK